MRSIWICLLWVLLPCWAVAATCSRIVYSTNPSYPPYQWLNQDGHFEGASIDLLRRIAPAGLELVEVSYPWKRSLYLAGRGEIDLLLSLRITPEREKTLLFTTHRAFPNPISAFVRKEKIFAFKSWSDLKERYGAISAGDTFGFGFDEYLRSDLTFEEGYTLVENFRKLQLGRVDYFVSGKYLGEAYLTQTGLDREITALSPPLTDGDIHFAFSRISPCRIYLDAMSTRLAEMDKSGESMKLLRKQLARFGHGNMDNVFVLSP